MMLMAAIDWYQFFFALFALIACLFAVAVLFTSNIVRMAFYLIVSLGATSGLFFLAGAEFVGAMQLMIYVGGTLVLLVFGVMLTAQDAFVSMKTRPGEWVIGLGVGGALLALLLHVAFQVEDWKTPRADVASVAIADSKQETPIGVAVMGARVDKNEQPNAVLRSGMSGYLLPFEIVSVHLLVVLIGAGYLARTKRRVAGVQAASGRVSSPGRMPLLVSGLATIGLLANLAAAAVCFFASEQIIEVVGPIFGEPTGFGMMAVGFLFLLSALLLVVVLFWQSWGVYALFVVSLAQAFLLWQCGVGLPGSVLFFVAAIAPVVLLVVLLCRGGQQSVWSRME